MTNKLAPLHEAERGKSFRVARVTPFLADLGGSKNLLFVKVETDGGPHGWGECDTQANRDRSIVAHLDALARYLVGRYVAHIGGNALSWTRRLLTVLAMTLLAAAGADAGGQAPRIVSFTAHAIEASNPAKPGPADPNVPAALGTAQGSAPVGGAWKANLGTSGLLLKVMPKSVDGNTITVDVRILRSGAPVGTSALRLAPGGQVMVGGPNHAVRPARRRAERPVSAAARQGCLPALREFFDAVATSGRQPPPRGEAQEATS